MDEEDEKDIYKLEDFLPIYPEFDQQVSEILGKQYVESGDPNFNIYRKKEFYDYRLDKQELKPEKPGQLMKHQVIVSRFLSSNTPYNGILLMHEPGTGKSCSSVGAIEQIRSESNNYDGALILMKGSNLINNYINELVFVCTCREQDENKKCISGPYISDDYHEENITEEQKKRRINAKIKEFYEFDTFGVFSTKVNKMRDEIIKKKYNNKIIVIDEVHNLRLKDEENYYSIIHHFLHTVENSKIILLTGTPMVDKPEEIASIMNLILPSNYQLPVEDEFVKEYLIKSDEKNISRIDPDKVDDLKSYLHGYVSYLKAMRSDVSKTYMGDMDIGIFNLYSLLMSEFQSDVYEPAYIRDKDSSDKKGVYNDSIQSSLFVFPDGTYGTEGFNKYVKQTTVKSMLDDSEKTVFKLSNILRDEIINETKDNKERLERLRKYSVIYADCIEKLINPNDKSNHFIYIKLVKGSGAILFSKILELFGFKESKGGFNKGLNYSIITNATTTDKENLDILKTFNHRSNIDGKYIKVIIGSKVISEGITFKNIQNIHIFTPSWNFSETDQAIARGYRLFSHKDLEDAGIDVNVKIYLYCAIPYKGNYKNSIDYQMYNVSKDKDISIKSIEKVIKEASFDCALNKNRNTFSSVFNNSRECNYGSCKYTCDGVPDVYINKLSEEQIDISTYELYYNTDDINKIIQKIIEIFETYNIVSLTIDKLSQMVDTDMKNIINSIIKMVSNNITVNSVLGYKCFFRFDNNTLYLTYNLKNNTNFFDSYYIEYFPLQKQINFNDKIEEVYELSLPKLFKAMKNEKDIDMRREILRKFPLYIQEILLEVSILSSELALQNIHNLREFILQEFEPFVQRFDDVIISTLMEDNLRCLRLDDIKEENPWKNCSDDDILKVREKMQQKKTEIHDNPYGYYGIFNKNTDKFSIADIVAEKGKVRLTKTGKVDSRRASTGRVCTTWKHTDLLELIHKIKLEFPKEFFTKNSKKTDQDLNDDIYKDEKYIEIASTFTREVFEEMSREDKLRVIYWGRSGKDSIKKPQICKAIQKWFKDNNLLEEKITK
jgi:hypothetical protein